MPVKSKKQEKLMQAVANNPKFAKKVGISKDVAKEMLSDGYAKSDKKTSTKKVKKK